MDRAVALLRAVATATGAQSTAPALAEACDLNRATAWRILSTLETHGMVSCDRATGRWSIGLTVAEIAGNVGIEGLIATAHAVLERLAALTGETAALAVVRGEGLTYVDEVAPTAIVSAKWLGRSVPLHATSTGKALLAFLSEKEVERLLPRELTAHTATTITDRNELLEELALTREQGYGVCRGELESSLYGVSAPALDRDGRPIAVISIWGPGVRVTEARFATLGALTAQAGAEVALLRAGSQGTARP
ncbi:IclR family transcriptional regulator [Nocardioides sp.]|uniref:IclR family transcriptional regulator n=1 Tax=Nocardioides sp. TaxID=35761 RepID=UPI003D0C6676